MSGNSATATLSFATNASAITIGSQGGTTTVRNSLTVDANARFNASVTQCGGYANYSFVGFRAQGGTNLQAHTAQSGTNPARNVDIINVSVPTGSITTITAECNQFDGGAYE